MRIVIGRLASKFARHGIPLEVCSDNGPQLVSNDLKKFAARFIFCDVTSSPQFPRANGPSEKGKRSCFSQDLASILMSN